MFGVWGQIGPVPLWIDGTISHSPDPISPANTGKGVNKRSNQINLKKLDALGKIRRNNTEGTTLVFNIT